MNKEAKYKSGDVLTHTNIYANIRRTVILDSRYDKLTSQDIAWWVFDYPEKTDRYVVPERELSLN
jgi:hypothetical protein